MKSQQEEADESYRTQEGSAGSGGTWYLCQQQRLLECWAVRWPYCHQHYMGGLLWGDLKPEKLWPGAHQVQLKTGVDPSVRRSGSVRTSTESPLWTQKTERC